MFIPPNNLDFTEKQLKISIKDESADIKFVWKIVEFSDKSMQIKL